MSTTIDEKVVEMRFNNRDFESRVKETMSTLDKFKAKLNLTGASKGLDNLNKSANKVNMSGMSNALDTVHAKFSALEIMGTTALVNITNQAVNAGKRMISALTVAPVRDGWSEYEMTLNAVQTTMAGTGKTAEEVEAQLKRLDDYADETVYSTADMLNNLPKFTNAGVDLEKATTAMIGIANATAHAGGDASKASIAFYNLGQAIGTGYLTRMDYNSINNAGIATMEWKNQMVEAAIAAGTLKKVGEDSYKAGNKTLTLQQLFIDGLQEQWATTDVMMKVFGDYGDATTEIGKKAMASAKNIKTFSMMMDSLKATAGTGWKETWQIIFGGIDEATEFWTDLSDFISGIITGMAEFRNNLLEGALGRGFKNIGKVISSITQPIKKTVETVEKMTYSLKDLEKMADEVIYGSWGNGKARLEALTEAGYNYYAIQNKVNEKLGDSFRYSDDLVNSQKQLNDAQEESGEIQTKLTGSESERLEQLVKMSDAELKALDLTQEQIDALRELKKYSDMTGLSIADFMANIDEIDGRWLLINSFKNAGQGLVSVFRAMKQAWQEIFPPMTSDRLFAIIAGLHKFSLHLRMSDETADKLKRTLKGVFAIIDIILTVITGPIKLAGKILLQFLQALGVLPHDILGITAVIGDAIVKVRDWVDSVFDLTGIFKALAPYVKAAASAVVDWFKAIGNSDAVKKFTEFLRNAKDAIVDWVNGLKEAENIPKYIFEGLINGLVSGARAVVDLVINLGKMIIDGICNVLGIRSPSRVFFAIGGFIVAGLLLGLQNGFDTVWDAIKGFGLKCVEVIKNIDFGKLLAVGVAAGLIVTVKQMLNVIELFGDIAQSIVAPLQGFGDLLSGIGSYWEDKGKAKKLLAYSEIIKSVGISIALLAGSLFVISKIDANRLWQSVGAMGALIGMMLILVGVVAGINKLGGNVASLSLTSTMLGITGALLILSFAMKKLSTIDPSRMDSTIKGLIAMVAGIGALIIAIGKFIKDDVAQNIHKVGKMIKKISWALLIMVAVVKLASMLKDDEIGRGIVVIGMFGLFIAALIKVSSIAGENADKAGKMIKKVSWSLLIMVAVFKLAGLIKENEIGRAIALMLTVGLFFSALIAVSYFAGQHADKAGKMISKISWSLLIMVAVFKLAGTLNAGDITKGMGVIKTLSAFFVALIAVSYFAGQHAVKAGTMLLMISGALLILTGVLFLLSKMDGSGLYRALAIVSVLELLFMGLIYVSQYANGQKTALKTLTKMIAMIVILAVAVVGLSFIDPARLWSAAGSISIMMVALGAMMASTKLLSGGSANLKNLAMVALIVAALAGILGLLERLDVAPSIETATAVSELVLAFSGAVKILSTVGIAGTAATAGIKALAILIGAMGGILVALGLLFKIPYLEELLDKGIPILEKIGYALGSFVGNIIGGLVGGIVDGATKGLPELGNRLSEFMGNLSGFLEGAKGIKSETLDGIKNLTEAIMMITGANFLDAIVGKLTGTNSLDKFGKDLPKLAEHIVVFTNKLGTFNDDQVKTVECAGKAIKALAEAANELPGEDGWLQTLTGKKNLKAFSKDLPDVADGLNEFIKNLGSFGKKQIDTVNCAGDAIKKLADAADKLPAQDGWLQTLTGKKNLKAFTSDLPDVADGLNEFIENLGTFGKPQIDTINCAVDALKSLAGAAQVLPEDGWLQVITGRKNLAAFSNELPQVAEGLVDFLEAFDDMQFGEDQVKTIDCAGRALKALADSAGSIPETNIFSWLTGWTDYEGFGDGLYEIGRGLRRFVKCFDEFTPEQVASVDSAVRALAVVSSLGVLDGANYLDSYGSGLEEYGARLISFANKTTEFIKSLSSYTVEDSQAAVDKLKNIVSLSADISNVDTSKLDSLGEIFGALASLKEKDIGFGVSRSDVSENYGEFLTAYGNKITEFVSKINTITADQFDTAIGRMTSLTMTVKDIASVDTTTLEPIVGILDQISEIGWFDVATYGSNMEGFADKTKLFVEKMKGISLEDAQSAKDKTDKISEIFTSISALDTSVVTSFADSLNSLAVNGFESFISAFSGDISKTKVTEAINTLLDTLISAVGFRQDDVKTKFVELSTTGVGALNSEGMVRKATQAGIDLIQGLINGLKNPAKLQEVYDAAYALGQKAVQGEKDGQDSNSPSKATEKAGKWLGEGLIIGMKRIGNSVYRAGENMGEKATNSISGALDTAIKLIDSDMDAQPTIRPILDLSDVESGVGRLSGMFNNGPSIGVTSNLRAISAGMNARSQNGANDDVISALDKLGKNLGNAGGNTYNINGVTYDDGSNISNAVEALVRAARVERRI